jgi:sigma-B regulation protein RsbU (phosphoserine phosphatase)
MMRVAMRVLGREVVIGLTTQENIDALQHQISILKSIIDVSAIITSTLDLDELITLVMEKAQSVMHAEASSVMLLNEKRGVLECRFALGTVQDQMRNKIELQIGQGIAGWVAEKGEPLIVQDVKSDSRFYQHVDKITGFNTRSILAAPLIVKGRVIGVAEVLNRLDGKPFTNEDLDIFVTFCQQVGLAIENAKVHQYMLEEQRLNQQLESAHSIQQSFMPQSFPDAGENRYALYGRNLPAKSVGGDMFDFFEIGGGQLALAISDVAGKGIPAALYMARLVSDLRYYGHLINDPVETIGEINRLLYDRSQFGMFVTLQYIILDAESGIFSMVNAGHLPALLVRAEQKETMRLDTSNGIPLGIMPDNRLEACSGQLHHGDYLVMFTDGIIEAKNRTGEQYSMRRLEEFINDSWESPQEMVNAIMESVVDHAQGTEQHDDMTVLVLQWR